MTFGKDHIRFVIVIIATHTIAYLFAGGISYQFITKEMWAGPDSLLAVYLRTPANSELWNYAMTWQIPGQLVRGLLMGLALLPLYSSAKEWSVRRKFLFFSMLLFVFTHFAASAPSPANIEGLVYLKPEFVRLGFIKMQAEMILYSIIGGILFSRYAYKKSAKPLTETIS